MVEDGRDTDSCFALVGAHQCGVQMACWDDWLPMYPPPVQDLWFQTKADREATVCGLAR